MDPYSNEKNLDKAMLELHEAVRKLAEAEGGSAVKLYRPINVEFKCACEAAMDALEAVTIAGKYSHVNWLTRDLAQKSEKAMSVAAKAQQERQAAGEVCSRRRERPR